MNQESRKKIQHQADQYQRSWSMIEKLAANNGFRDGATFGYELAKEEMKDEAIRFAEFLSKNGYGITEHGDWFFEQTPIEVMGETKESIFTIFEKENL